MRKYSMGRKTMVLFPIFIVYWVIDTKFVSAVASLCLGDDYLPGGACDEKDEASHFLQLSSFRKTVASVDPQREKKIKEIAGFYDVSIEEATGLYEADEKQSEIKRLVQTENISKDEAHKRYMAIANLDPKNVGREDAIDKLAERVGCSRQEAEALYESDLMAKKAARARSITSPEVDGDAEAQQKEDASKNEEEAEMWEAMYKVAKRKNVSLDEAQTLYEADVKAQKEMRETPASEEKSWEEADHGVATQSQMPRKVEQNPATNLQEQDSGSKAETEINKRRRRRRRRKKRVQGPAATPLPLLPKDVAKPKGPIMKPLGNSTGPIMRPIMKPLGNSKGPMPLMRPLGQANQLTKFNCVKYGTPIQALKSGKKGFAFFSLNVETGKYEKVYDVPFSRTTPKYQDLNACGINPVDDMMYCALKAKEMYIARIDQNTVEFVAKAPGFGKPYTSGTFSPDGTMFIANDQAGFLVVSDIAEAKGFPDKKDKRLLDLTSEELVKPKGFHSAADVVVVRHKLENTGGKKDYVMILNRGALQVARYDIPKKKFGKTWVIPYKLGKKKKGKWNEIWGAGWTFTGKVFFASNEGKGVYQVDLGALNLTKSVEELSPFQLTKAGISNPSSFNDGANCLNSPDPWKTKVIPFDCKAHPSPVQILRGESGYDVKKLLLATGKYVSIYSLPFDRTVPAFKYLNAVGINPMDGIPYGCLLFGEFPSDAYIVRFDAAKIEYVAKMPGKYDPIAGTFTRGGDYFFMHNTKDSMDPVLYSVKGLDSMKGFLNHADPKLPVIKKKKMKGFTLTDFYQFADIVAVKYDFEVAGSKTDYIVGINDRRQVAVVKWNDDSPDDSKVWRFATNDVLGKEKAYQNFGAAYNYQGRVFFASNDGAGVFEAKKLDFAKRVLTIRKISDSAPIVNTDGFNCLNVRSPFPNNDENKPVVTAFRDSK